MDAMISTTTLEPRNKNLIFPLNPGCSSGILATVYHNPDITG